MKSKDVEVIKLLIENKEKDLSINQVAKLLKKDYKNAHNIVTRLSKMQLVQLQPFGNSHKVVLLNKMHPLLFEAEYLRRNELLKDKDFAVIYDSLKSMSSKLYILLLFGSYAKKTQTRHSDIDMMFIVPDEVEEIIEKEINSIIRTLPLKIHANIFTERDFKAMRNSKEVTVGTEAMKNNVIMHGIESYYELIL